MRVRRVVALVSGAGFPFLEGGGIKRRALRATVSGLYRTALGLTDRVWFQNSDDLGFFVTTGLLTAEKALLIRSGGVNIAEFSMAGVDQKAVPKLRKELKIEGGGPIVMMIVARLIWSKGIKEFVAASRILQQGCSRAQLLLFGPYDHGHPDEVPPGFLESVRAENFRAMTLFRTDVREILSLADVVVLPSYFGEGVPRILLEASAMGKPIVTTDNPGCREVVEHGRNGYLVPVKDPRALAAAIADLSNSEAVRVEFGRHSRLKAETEFDEQLIVDRIVRELYEVAY